jgi:hypothetical protein
LKKNLIDFKWFFDCEISFLGCKIHFSLGVLACGTRYHWKSDHHVTMKHLRNLTTLYTHLPDIRCFDYRCSFDLALFSFFLLLIDKRFYNFTIIHLYLHNYTLYTNSFVILLLNKFMSNVPNCKTLKQICKTLCRNFGGCPVTICKKPWGCGHCTDNKQINK